MLARPTVAMHSLVLSRGTCLSLALLLTPVAQAGEPPAPKQDGRFTVETIRGGEAIKFEQADGGLILSVRSRSGIGRATVARKVASWPMVVKVRLHLKGLESFRISAGKQGVGVSVSSGNSETVRVHLIPEGREGPLLTKESLLWVKVKVVAKDKKIPVKDGYFELELPQALFNGNPAQISLHWIDFYRG
jgi:hypothetical protein